MTYTAHQKRISEAMKRKWRYRREKSAEYLDYIRSLPCLVCGDNTSTEAAHIRYADSRADKRQTGMGEKPDDVWTLPLCGRHHREQHNAGELEWWMANGIDPIRAAMALRLVQDDRERAERIIGAHKRG